MFLEVSKLIKKHPSQASAILKLLKASGMSEVEARIYLARAKTVGC